jgi:hypothetical protein
MKRGTATDEFKWTLLWRDSQKGRSGGHYGHSFYRDELTGNVALKDMSGDLPHTTDDGVLWVDHSRPVIFMVRGNDVHGCASFPLLAESGKTSMTGMRWVDAIRACRELDLRAKVDPEVGELFRLLADLAVLNFEKGE